MKTSTYTLQGKTYTLCFNARVMMGLEEKNISLGDVAKAKGVTDMITLLQLMIDAGDRYAKLEGIESPGTITLDELMDRIGPEDMDEVGKAVTKAVQGERTVRAEPPKNAEATQDQAEK